MTEDLNDVTKLHILRRYIINNLNRVRHVSVIGRPSCWKIKNKNGLLAKVQDMCCYSPCSKCKFGIDSGGLFINCGFEADEVDDCIKNEMKYVKEII